MSQGPLCPNLTKKFQKEVSQIANHNFPLVMLLGGLSVNLNHLKTSWLLGTLYESMQFTPINCQICQAANFIKRMHSSRMHIYRFRRVYTPYPHPTCLPLPCPHTAQVYAGIHSPVWPGACRDTSTHQPMDRMTDTQLWKHYLHFAVNNNQT